MSTSAIKYDHDHPHEMKMVWDVWLKKNSDLPDSLINELYGHWLIGKRKLYIDQAEWSRIVATYL